MLTLISGNFRKKSPLSYLYVLKYLFNTSTKLDYFKKMKCEIFMIGKWSKFFISDKLVIKRYLSTTLQVFPSFSYLVVN